MPSTYSVVIVALLLIAIKNRNILHKQLDERWQTNRGVLNKVLWWVLQPLIIEYNPSTKNKYYNVLCWDGNFRRCKPVLAEWLAHWPEYSDLHHLEQHVCSWCESPKNKLGDYVHQGKQYLPQNRHLYRMLSDANTEAADGELSSQHVHWGVNVFRPISCLLSGLRMPNLLHTKKIRVLHHLQ